MTEHELLVVKCMERFGGSFIQAFANCFRHADRQNKDKLKDAFSDYWKKYEEFVPLMMMHE